jgi:hypothetical protein
VDKLPSVDVFIGLFFVIGVAYTVLLRKEKAIATLAATYIALVITTSFGQTVFEFFNGNKVVANQIWVRSNASLTTVMIGLFILSIIFVSGAISASLRKADTGVVEIIIISALNVGLVISAIFSFMSPDIRTTYLAASKIAQIIVQYNLVWTVLPPIALIGLGFTRK